MNLLIVGGFLGSGKTSLILGLARHIVAKCDIAGGKVPLVIIENEIGQISIDDKVLERGGYEVRGLFAGCVCCTLTAGLNEYLAEIRGEFAPEWVIIEATGLAYPYKISDAIEGFLHIVPTIAVVVDAQRWAKLSVAVEPLMDGQIRNASALLLNKRDLVDAATLQKAKDEIANINPRAALFEVSAQEGIDESVWEAILNAH